MTEVELAEQLVIYLIFSKGNLTAGRCKELIREIFGDEMEAKLKNRLMEKGFKVDASEVNQTFNCPPPCPKCHRLHHNNEPCSIEFHASEWGFEKGIPIKFKCNTCSDRGVIDGPIFIREGIGPQHSETPCPDCGKKQ